MIIDRFHFWWLYDSSLRSLWSSARDQCLDTIYGFLPRGPLNTGDFFKVCRCFFLQFATPFWTSSHSWKFHNHFPQLPRIYFKLCLKNQNSLINFPPRFACFVCCCCFYYHTHKKAFFKWPSFSFITTHKNNASFVEITFCNPFPTRLVQKVLIRWLKAMSIGEWQSLDKTKKTTEEMDTFLKFWKTVMCIKCIWKTLLTVWNIPLRLCTPLQVDPILLTNT